MNVPIKRSPSLDTSALSLSRSSMVWSSASSGRHGECLGCRDRLLMSMTRLMIDDPFPATRSASRWQPVAFHHSLASFIVTMPVICLGPVCIPIWPLVVLILKPAWNLLPQQRAKSRVRYTMWESLTFIPERFRPRRPASRGGKVQCKNGVCTWTPDDNGEVKKESSATTPSTDAAEFTEEGEVIELQEPEEFDELVMSNKMFIVDYSAEWCHPCQLIAPVFAELAGQYKGKAKFVRVDVDVLDDLALDNGVTSLPAFHIYKGNEKLETVVGANPEKLRAVIAKRCE